MKTETKNNIEGGILAAWVAAMLLGVAMATGFAADEGPVSTEQMNGAAKIMVGGTLVAAVGLVVNRVIAHATRPTGLQRILGQA